MNSDKRQKNEKKFWNRNADKYDKQVGEFNEAYKKTLDHTIENTSPKSDILEVGCGTGIISLGIAPHIHSLVATDISENMISIAEKKAIDANIKNITFLNTDGYNLGQGNKKFDAILIYNVLHLVKKPQQILLETKKHLKTEGIIFIADDCFNEKKTIKAHLMVWLYKIVRLLGVIPYISFYSKHSLRKLLEDNGFIILKDEELFHDPVNYFIMAKMI